MTTERPRRRAPGWRLARIYTVGHSTRPMEELVELLRAHDIHTLVDIRTVPRSRKNPQYAQGKDSPNSAWRNASFRGYADYMQTDEFTRGLEELRALTPEGPLALMCAEAVPWRCHRSLVADALFARGVEVRHISSRTRAAPHRLTPFAELHGRQVLYPGTQEATAAEAAP